MVRTRWSSWLGLLLVSCVAATRAAAHTTVHRCLPGSEPFVCTLQRIDYEPDENIPVFHLPAAVKAIRFTKPFNSHERNNRIRCYDAVLHRQLSSPAAIEIRGADMSTIEIPPNLVYADFGSNHIMAINVSPNEAYAMQYLNLDFNSYLDRTNIANISRLANLEALHLSNTYVNTFPNGFFDNLTRLAHLTLRDATIKQFDLALLPPSISVLSLENNEITRLSFAKVSLPLLTDLNVMHNALQEVNVQALLAIAPQLALLSLGHNPIKRNTLAAILDELDRRNVSYHQTDLPIEAECYPNERPYRGTCVPMNSFPMEVGDWLEIVALVCLLVAMLIGAAFGCIKLWKRYRPA